MPFAVTSNPGRRERSGESVVRGCVCGRKKSIRSERTRATSHGVEGGKTPCDGPGEAALSSSCVRQLDKLKLPPVIAHGCALCRSGGLSAGAPRIIG